MSSRPRIKGRTADELSLEMAKLIDGLNDGSIAPGLATKKIVRSANVQLRSALGEIKRARARGDKPNVPFFADGATARPKSRKP